MSKPGYYIFLDENRQWKNGFFFGYVPLFEKNIDLSFVHIIFPYEVPDSKGSLISRVKSLERKRLQIKNVCQKNITLSENLLQLIMDAFAKNSMSIVSSSGVCYSGLHFVRIDENGNRAFLDMLSLHELEKCFEKSNFVELYMLLYENVEDFFVREMALCDIACEEFECGLINNGSKGK